MPKERSLEQVKQEMARSRRVGIIIFPIWHVSIWVVVLGTFLPIPNLPFTISPLAWIFVYAGFIPAQIYINTNRRLETALKPETGQLCIEWGEIKLLEETTDHI